MGIYLVTGGAGFIGSNIVETLLGRNCNVRILDNFSTGKKENIERIIKRHSLTLDRDYVFIKGTDKHLPVERELRLIVIEGDIRDIDACKKAVSGVSYVLHQGALPSVPRSIADPMTTNVVNINGTLNMLISSRDAGVRRFVFASSSSVYGDTPTLPKVETMPTSPLSPYALSKLTGEIYTTLFHRIYGLSTVALRYFNVYGQGQDPTSQYAAVIPKFITAVLAGKGPTIYGDGEQSRDFTYIEDCVEANILSCTETGVSGAVMNIACGRRTTLNDLFKKICDLVEADVKAEYTDARPGDVKHSLADIRRAMELLRYSPKYTIDEGLKKTIEWFKGK
ncbi:MAG: Vi polysaccharide biosynthesis protein VipB/TviC [Nitrospirae bacterium RIFCSPLOWO2_02_42_7]|nr:MAG: Vi polysaccharide biosynthesis protein VipB/TviC [Nitrospirae bacterium RIFCSPLOWO2_02_42_7]